MTLATFRLDLRRNRGLIVWIGLITVLYSGSMALFFPLLRENTELLEQYLDLFPEAFLAAFGMTGSLADPGVFFTTYIGIFLWPFVAGIAAIVAATRPVAADLERGFLELPLATPLPRRRYLAVSIAGQALMLLILALATVLAVVAVGAVVDARFDVVRFLMVVPVLFVFGAAIAGVATLLSVLTLSRGIAAGVTVGLLLGMYLIHVIAQLEPDLAWLSNLSAFGYFDATGVIDDGRVPWLDLAVLGGVAVAGWLGALLRFHRRDLAA